MTLKKCLLIKNSCYLSNRKMPKGKPEGIVVHSTGANNPYLKRYVQPVAGQANYDTIIADLGKNTYGNHWNMNSTQMGREVCVHAFIGLNAKDKIETYQTLPFDICCWGVGSGSKGSYNFNPARVQFEICEDGLTDKNYFNKVFKEAIEFCAHLCLTYNISVNKISSHHESYIEGYGGNHGDCDHWLAKHGKTMDWFRAEVKKLVDANSGSKDKNDKEAANSSNKNNSNTNTEKTDNKTNSNTANTTTNKNNANKTIYKVQTGAYKLKLNANSAVKKLKSKGFEAVIVSVYGYYKVQVGAYSKKANAENMLKKLKASGFDGTIVTANTTTTATTSTSKTVTFKVGDKVTLKKNAPIYGTKNTFSSWVYNSTLYVREIDGSRIVISTQKTGDITGAVDKKYLTKK
jgi:hypothetical protein